MLKAGGKAADALERQAFAAALRDSALPPPAQLSSPGCGARLADRFAIHRANHAVSLRDALAEQFPVCRQLVGDEFFNAVAAAYVAAEPPREASLQRYGDRFAGFIAAFPPCASIDYLADVAKLEFAWREAWAAAEAPGLTLEGLRGPRAQQLLDRPLALHPAVRRLRSDHPVASIWLGHQGDGPVRPPDDWQPEQVLVCRPDADVTVHRLDAATAALLEALAAGATLAEAAEAAGPDAGTAQAFLTLVGCGVFLSPPEPESP